MIGKGFGFLFEMGCGKTLTSIAVAGAGYKLGHLKRALIIAPTSVCAVWPKEFQEYADFPYTVRTLHKTTLWTFSVSIGSWTLPSSARIITPSATVTP